MTLSVGRLSGIALKKQSTRGTTETTTTGAIWIPRTSFNFRDVAENTQNESTISTLDAAYSASNTEVHGEGEMDGNIRLKESGVFFNALLGSPTTTGASAPYTHTFKMVQNALGQQYTVFKKDEVSSKRYGNAVLTNLEIEANLASFVSFSSTWISKKSDDQSPAPTAQYTSDDFFVTKQVTASYGGTATKVQSASLSFEKPVENVINLGDDTPQDFLSTMFTVTGELEMLYESDSFREDMLSSDISKDIVLTFQKDASNKMVITLRNCFIQSVDPDYSNDSIVKISVEFMALYDMSNSNSESMNVVLTNSQASY